MTDYDPPLVNLPIFDKLVFINPDDYITQSQADKRYLKFPNAQGTENLQTTNINGVLTVNSTSNFANNINMSSNDPNQRYIYASFFNSKDIKIDELTYNCDEEFNIILTHKRKTLGWK